MTFGLEQPFQQAPLVGQNLDNSPSDELLFALAQLNLGSLRAELGELEKRFPFLRGRIVLALGQHQAYVYTNGASVASADATFTLAGGRNPVTGTVVALRLSSGGRMALYEFIPEAPFRVQNSGTGAVTVSVQRVAGAGKILRVEGGSVHQGTGATAQPNLAYSITDSADGVLWQGGLACPANDSRSLQIPPGITSSVAGTLTLTGSGNGAAAVNQYVNFNGYEATP